MTKSFMNYETGCSEESLSFAITLQLVGTFIYIFCELYLLFCHAQNTFIYFLGRFCIYYEYEGSLTKSKYFKWFFVGGKDKLFITLKAFLVSLPLGSFWHISIYIGLVLVCFILILPVLPHDFTRCNQYMEVVQRQLQYCHVF